METLRQLLWFSLSAILVGLVYAWQQDYDPQATQTVPDKSNSTTLPLATPSSNPLAPIPSERQITFETDVLTGIIDKQDGNLVYLALLQYPESVQDKTQPFVLVDRDLERHQLAQTGLLMPGESVENRKGHLYQAGQRHYHLPPEIKTLHIDLHREEEGVHITKQIILQKGQYQIDVQYQIRNGGQRVYKVQPYAELTQQNPAKDNKSVISSDKEVYEKLPFKRFGREGLPQNTRHAWLSFTQPYFTNTWISRLPQVSYYSHHKDKNYTLGMLGDIWEVMPSERKTGSLSLYAGPKSVDALKASAKHLHLLVDYGFFSLVAKSLLWSLRQCHQWIGNWGWSLVCVSACLKLLAFPLTVREFRLKRAMRRLQPQLKALKARYSNDWQGETQAQSALYKREGVNPLIDGSWAILMQVFTASAINALFSESIELRQAYFTAWIPDLCASDPYYIMPTLFGLAIAAEQAIDQRLVVGSTQNNGALLLAPILIALTFIYMQMRSGFILFFLVQYLLSALQKWWLVGRPLPYSHHMQTTP